MIPSKLLLAAALAFALLPAAVARAQYLDGDWDLTLSGTADDSSSGASAAGVGATFGYLINHQVEVFVRQDILVGVVGGPSDRLEGFSGGGADVYWPLGRLQSYVGANVLCAYGRDRRESWLAGPEIGIKYFLNASAYVFVSGSWEIPLRSGDDSVFTCGVGIGFDLR